LEQEAKVLDELRVPVRQVGQGALDDLGAFAVALAQQHGGRGVAVRDGLDVHVLHGSKRRGYIKDRFVIYMGTDRHKEMARTRAITGFASFRSSKLGLGGPASTGSRLRPRRQ